jgi:hypothetical protein
MREDRTMTDAPPLVLLHSPLVGPLTWRSVAAELRAGGIRVAVPELTFGDGATFADGPGLRARLVAQAAAACRETAGDAAPVLVVHSGAGALVPSIAALAPVRAAVYVDALLPHPGRSWFDTVDTETAAFLRGLAVGGLLPPWHTWFAADAFDPLLPDPLLRAVFLQELSPLPLAYFEETAPDLPAPRGSYVRTSEAYNAEADAAEALGWPVVRLPLDNHLAPITQPKTIADVVAELSAELSADPPGGARR